MITIATYSDISVTYTGDGSETEFSFPFDYLKKSFVYVEVDDEVMTQDTDYEVSDEKTVVFAEAPEEDSVIKIYRSTDTTPLVSWADASVLRAKDLTIQETQYLHILEEQDYWTRNNCLLKDEDDDEDIWDAQGMQIKDVADPTDEQDAVTLGYLQDNALLLNDDGDAWDAEGLQIKNVAEPTDVSDAATRQYVDSLISGVSGQSSNTVVYDNVETMKAADLAEGMTAVTKGYYDINDGGQGVYDIRAITDDDTVDEGSIIAIGDGTELVAELITDGTVNVKQFGAVGGANYYSYDDEKWYKSITGASVAIYYNPDDSSFYTGAVYTTEGAYYNMEDSTMYVDSEFTTEAPYYNVEDGKFYQTAVFTDQANCYSAVDGKWYSGATFSDEATDESEILQKALDFARILDLQGTNFVIEDPVEIPSNITIKNGGFVLTTVNQISLYATSQDNITLDNVMIVHAFDETLRTVYQVHFTSCSNILFNNCTTSAFALKNINFIDIDKLTINRCKFRSVKGTAVNITGGYDVKVIKNVFDAENAQYQVYTWHMFDLRAENRDSINVLVDGCSFFNNRGSAMQFTGNEDDDDNDYDFINTLITNCQFYTYCGINMKIDGVVNTVDITNCHFRSYHGHIVMSGGSGVADKVRIINNVFLDAVDYSLHHLLRTSDDFTLLEVRGNTFENCALLVDVKSAPFDTFIFNDNVIRNSTFYIYRGSGSAPAKCFICNNNKYYNATGATALTLNNTEYQEFCNNYFDTPVSALSSYEFAVFGMNLTDDDYASINTTMRLENNTFVNCSLAKIYTTGRFETLFYNGNRFDGETPTLGTGGTITEQVTYATS